MLSHHAIRKEYLESFFCSCFRNLNHLIIKICEGQLSRTWLGSRKNTRNNFGLTESSTFVSCDSVSQLCLRFFDDVSDNRREDREDAFGPKIMSTHCGNGCSLDSESLQGDWGTQSWDGCVLHACGPAIGRLMLEDLELKANLGSWVRLGL